MGNRTSDLQSDFEKGQGVERSSSGRALCCNGLDPPAWRINPAWWMHLQFGLFSIPTSGPQLVHQMLWYALSYLWDSAYKRSLAAYRNE